MDEDSPMKPIAVRRGLRAVSVVALALLSACAVERTPPAPACTGTETPASRTGRNEAAAHASKSARAAWKSSPVTSVGNSSVDCRVVVSKSP